MENHYLPTPKHFSTMAIHSSNDFEDSNLAIVPPIVSATNFKIDYLSLEERPPKYRYSKISNPTRSNLERCLASLEGGKYCICYASGSGTLIGILGLLKPGANIICCNSIYGGTFKLLNDVATNFGFTTTFIDVYNLEKLQESIKPNTELIWIETVSNPLLKIADVKATSQIAHRHNILLAVDNTFLTPYLHRPLEFGADIVCHSLSKYLNGHGDVIMGALIMNEKEMYDKLNNMQYVMGITPSPFDCSQAIRSLKTLPMRMKLHRNNAMKVAQFLETHTKVTKVIHPGLPSHPQHELFKKQTSGHSGLITFYVDGDLNTAKRLLSNFKLITPTSSFGSTESIAEVTVLMSQSIVPKDSQDINVTDNLIRLSVGLEDEEDIIFDLNQALNNI